MRRGRRCGSWPQPGCWPIVPTVGRTGRGMRCCLRRWRPACCPTSGPRCTSAQQKYWKAPTTARWPRRRPGTGPLQAGWTRNCPRGVAAAAAAERVFGYAEAAAHWQRAIELGQAVPEASQAWIDVPRLYLRAIRALENSGDSEKAGQLAEEAYRRFAGRTLTRRPPLSSTSGPGSSGHAHACGRAPPDQGSAAAVRAGPAVGRPGRGLAHLRQRLLVARRGPAGGRPRRVEPRAGDRRIRRRHCGHLPDPRSWHSTPSSAGRSRKGSPCCCSGGRPWPRHPRTAKQPCGRSFTKPLP